MLLKLHIGLALGLLIAPAALRAESGPVSVAGEFELVWSYADSACSETDYSDVPVRPFLTQSGQVLWFASNSTGYLATEGTSGGADILAGMERIGCKTWLRSVPYTSGVGKNPRNYRSGVWMVAPFTPNGRAVYALVHNEFHGEWTGNPKYCDQQNAQSAIVLYCDYWNLTGAYSFNAGQNFAINGRQADGAVLPAIALPDPYTFIPANPANTSLLEQGMAAQSNIIQWGHFYYVLVDQLTYGPAGGNPQDGVCVFRTNDLADFQSWRGWSGETQSYSVPTVRFYPPQPGNTSAHCTPVLPALYRFSWSYNVALKQFLIIGLDATYQGGQQPAIVYTTATLDPATGLLDAVSPEMLLIKINWLPQWQKNPSVTGFAYPSLLDPTSPQISDSRIPNQTPGDRNFQYSGTAPYLYLTRLNPRDNTNNNPSDRDVVRLPLKVVAPQARPDVRLSTG